jgi:hypothetical protein
MKRSSTSLTSALYYAWQLIFTLLVISTFIVVWLVQAGTIVMPEWTKELGSLSHDDRRTYTAVLSTGVCVLFALSVATGVAVVRSESG